MYHPSLESILDTPEIREIKKLDLIEQRAIFNSISIKQIKKIFRPGIIEKDIYLENNTILRYYKSQNINNKAILFIHGGGWCLNSIDTYDHVCRYICENSNINVFSLEYGLAPEYKYPSGVEHALYAYDWLYKNIDTFNINPKNMFVMGDSAGGNLVSIICNERQQNMPKAQILLYPAVDMYTKYKSNYKFNYHKYHLTSEWCEMFLKAYLGEEILYNPKKLRDPRISPLFYKDTKHCDTLIIAATHDILIDGIYAYEKKLKKEGGLVETYYDDEMYHGFISMIDISPLQNATIALNKVIEFINIR